MVTVTRPQSRRGGRPRQRADPVRHLQHRRARDHQGRGGVRPLGGRSSSRRSATRPSTSSPARPAGATSSPGCAGADPEPRRAADPRPPRRRARRGRRLERAPVLRRRRGRLRVGPRRDRHEGHGRHDDRRRAALQARRASCRRATWCSRSSPTRRPAASTAAQWLVENRPDLFEGVTEAIGEVGGFSLTVPHRDGGERRLYLIETAEKGMRWMRLTARGRAGHGSMVHDDNAVTAVAEAVARLGRHQFPLVLTDPVAQFLTAVGEETGYTLRPGLARPRRRDRQARRRSPASSARRCATRPTRPCSRPATRPTSSRPRPRRWWTAGCCPAGREAFEREVDELIGPNVTREWITRPAVRTRPRSTATWSTR